MISLSHNMILILLNQLWSRPSNLDKCHCWVWTSTHILLPRITTSSQFPHVSTSPTNRPSISTPCTRRLTSSIPRSDPLMPVHFHVPEREDLEMLSLYFVIPYWWVWLLQTSNPKCGKYVITHYVFAKCTHADDWTQKFNPTNQQRTTIIKNKMNPE